MSEKEKRVLSIPQAAKSLGVSTPIMYQLVKTKGFPTIHIGKRTLIPVEGLERWIIENTTTGGKSNV